jgi:hypothetical protein
MYKEMEVKAKKFFDQAYNFKLAIFYCYEGIAWHTHANFCAPQLLKA